MKNFLLKTWLTMLCLLLGVGTSWAETLTVDFESETTAYTNWTFTNFTSKQTNTNVTAHGGNYFGTTNGQQSGNLQTKEKIVAPKTIVCYVSKATTNTTASNWKIQVSSNGTSWTDVKSQSATSMTRGNWNEFSADLSSFSNVYVRIYYTGTTALRCIDDVSLTYSNNSGSEKTLLSIAISGMPNKVTYKAGEVFDPTGLVVTGTYSDTSTGNLTAQASFSCTPSTLDFGTSSVSVTATVNKISSVAYNVTVTVNPNIDYVILPWEWKGGVKADLVAIDGVIGYGLGSDYAEGNAPYRVKLDDTNDYIMVKTNEDIGVCTIKVKMLGGATSSLIAVQGSYNGTNFTTVETLTISGDTNSTLELSTSGNLGTGYRYVKFLFTKGANVGVGGISIAKAIETDPTKEASSISITGTPDKFWIGDAFNHNGITVTATYDDESTEDVTNAAIFTGYDMSSAGKQTVTVTYQEQSATYDIEVKTIANTEATAYTTAEAIALIDAGKDLTTEVYVKGTVSNVDNYNGQYNSITYWLDNKTFEVYSGLAKEGEEFTSIDDIEVGAKVVVLGKIKKYNSIYELDKNNRLVSYEVTQPETKEYTVTYYVNGVPTTETLREGDKLNFPENPKMAGKVFRGWINQVKVEDSKTEPKYVTATTATEDATYFAVFATETVYPGAAGSDEWVELPSDFTNWRGEGIKFLLAYKVSATKAYVFDGTNNKPNYVEGKLNGKKLTKPEGAVAFILTPLDENSDYNKIELCIDNEYRYLSGKSNTNILRITNFEGATPGDKATTPTRTDFTYHNTYGWLIENCGTYMRFDGRKDYDCFWFVKKSTNSTPQYDNIALYYNQGASPDTYTYSDFTTNMDVIERKELTDKQYFTICYPYAVHPKAYAGAKAYNVVGKTMSGDRIATLELEEVAENAYLTAGMPYFMVGDATCFHGYHSLDNPASEAGNYNGLYGVFSDFAFNNENSGWAANEYYVITSNKVQAGTEISGVKANRAFIKKSEVPDYVAPGESAARFIIELEEGTLTELDEVELKPIETSIYNLQGQRINRADKGVYIVNGRKVIR